MRQYNLSRRPAGDSLRTRRSPIYTVAEACRVLGVPSNMHRYVGLKAAAQLKPGLGLSKPPRYPLEDLKALIIKEGITHEIH